MKLNAKDYKGGLDLTPEQFQNYFIEDSPTDEEVARRGYMYAINLGGYQSDKFPSTDVVNLMEIDFPGTIENMRSWRLMDGKEIAEIDPKNYGYNIPSEPEGENVIFFVDKEDAEAAVREILEPFSTVIEKILRGNDIRKLLSE